MLGKSLTLASAALALGLLTVPASAAPVSNLKGIEADASTQAETVHYRRRCWWHRGHMHCRRGYSRHYGYAPYYGYGPSFGFHFGGGRHHHWRRHRHW
jgi:hypothetical protein